MDARARVAPAAVERRLRLRDDQRDALDAAVGARAALRDDEEDGRAGRGGGLLRARQDGRPTRLNALLSFDRGRQRILTLPQETWPIAASGSAWISTRAGASPRDG